MEPLPSQNDLKSRDAPPGRSQIILIVRHFLPVKVDKKTISTLATIDKSVESTYEFFSISRTYAIRTLDLAITPRSDCLQRYDRRLERRFAHTLYILRLAMEYHRQYPVYDTTRKLFWETLDDEYRGQMPTFVRQVLKPTTAEEERQLIRVLHRGRRLHFFHVTLPGICLLLSSMPNVLDDLPYSAFLTMAETLWSGKYPNILNHASQLAEDEESYLFVTEEHMSKYIPVGTNRTAG